MKPGTSAHVRTHVRVVFVCECWAADQSSVLIGLWSRWQTVVYVQTQEGEQVAAADW